MQPTSGTPKIITDAEFIAFAESMVLRKPDLDVFREASPDRYPLLTQHIQKTMLKLQADGKLVMPNVRAFNSESIGVFSDYSGEGDGNYFIYSFFVCAFNCRDFFHREMRSIRSACGLGDKELAFKDLRMGAMRKALPAYLASLEKSVPGLLFTLVIDKRIRSVFGPSDGNLGKDFARMVGELGFGTWKSGSSVLSMASRERKT